jgi:hypothetical protein
MVGDMTSGGVSVGEGVSVTGGGFTFFAKNPPTGETIRVWGVGLGASVGVGLPVKWSDNVDVPGLPGWQSPFYLGPAGRSGMGHSLFTGIAQIFSVDAAVGLGYDVCAMQFMLPIGIPLELLLPGSLGYIFASRLVKVTTLMAGFFVEADASADVNGAWYLSFVDVISSPAVSSLQRKAA